ncbi:MAG TPA: exodeoxyribonuclease III [Candidatus Pacearchaeota archaeon]|nr:exodeoxyribonuclease III [Candidatus Pacearchaeota archaeon]
MKIISWNVNGIRSVLKKGFLDFVEGENPDVLCVQETKALPEQVEIKLDQFPHHHWNSAERKGYSGTAIFSKIKPLSISKGIGHSADNEGRVLTLEFDDFYLVNVYTVNSGRGLIRLGLRSEWDNQFLKFLKKLEEKKPVILCGDLNVAHKEIDLANPKSNYNKTAGYTQKEIDGFQTYVDNDFVDTFREFNKEPNNYTYWGVWNNLRERNIGWRIDYFLASKSFAKNVKNSFILNETMGSDHCPIGIELE